MNDAPLQPKIELLCVIANHGLGSKIIHLSKQQGVKGGTIFFGRGTIKNRLLEWLDLADIRKEIAIMIADQPTISKALKALDKEIKFHRPNHGIAFILSVSSLLGARGGNHVENTKNRGETNSMYNLITIIVDRGQASFVMDTARAAGSKGGTIINARGSGIHETSKLFSMEIEPEKELVLILSENHLTDSIIAAIREKSQIDKPGYGIIFVQEVNEVYGLYT